MVKLRSQSSVGEIRTFLILSIGTYLRNNGTMSERDHRKPFSGIELPLQTLKPSTAKEAYTDDEVDADAGASAAQARYRPDSHYNALLCTQEQGSVSLQDYVSIMWLLSMGLRWLADSMNAKTNAGQSDAVPVHPKIQGTCTDPGNR